MYMQNVDECYNYMEIFLSHCTVVRIALGSTVLVDGVTSTSSAVEHQLLAGMYLISYR